MCDFFSCISYGEVLFFKVEDIARVMAEGNPKNYEWNSHTSISHYFGIEPVNEEKWSFWEYNKDSKELKLDRGKEDDRETVKKSIEDYLLNKNIEWLLNFYNSNSGDRNSGHSNSGDSNSGHSNSGNRNSGHCNSGDRNSGNYNSGDGNSARGIYNYLCSEEIYYIFNKPAEAKDVEYLNNIYDLLNIDLTLWVSEYEMTEEEKNNNVSYKTTGGYLKVFDYKTAWLNKSKIWSKDDIKKIKKIKNFNSKVFEEITGIKL